MCAIYASVFKKAKERLKLLLNDKTIYADGLRPDELSNHAATVTEAKYFFENDLSK